ncbi:MAG TPA: GNAT family N-acetyltransferase [Actinomycetes bacterium]|jgi:ribosomal protein S18 acetylase RimI-like enzyme|nr:GNAT family N-acetyltransferase [Actinomycetes bacterium]
MESRWGGIVVLLDATDRAVAAELVALQRASYAVEAELIGFDGIPGLRESVEELMATGLVWLGVREGGRLAGALAYAHLAGSIDVDRLVVAPWAFRHGHGRALVTALIEREPAGRFLVSTGSRNQPARRLYESLGFRVVGEREIAPGILVTRYELELARG